MEIFTKNSAKCTIFQRNDCNNFSSLMDIVELEYVSALHQTDVEGGIRKDWSIHGENEKFTFDVTDAVMATKNVSFCIPRVYYPAILSHYFVSLYSSLVRY
jgi:hypothetical protein